MVDVSDGLASDLGHLAAASGVCVRLDGERLPRVAGASAIDAARSGEEYELALTARAALDERAFAAAFGVPLTRVGEVVPRGEGPGVELRLDGRRVDLPVGHDHFSR
jgi:thiamine-monophosphate kinase